MGDVMATDAVDENATPKGDAGRVTMWRVLLVGLFILAGLAIVGAIYLIMQGKDSSPAWVSATAVVTGTIGLFTSSPTGSSATQGRDQHPEQ